MDFKSALPLFERILSWLTFRRVFTLSVTAIVLITCVTLFENRTQLANSVRHRGNVERVISDEPFKVSENSQAEIKQFINKNKDVGVIVVMSVNMRALQRQPVYMYSNDPSLNELIESYSKSTNMSHPLFTNEESNDSQMIGLMNGEFQCVKFEETVNAIIFPGIKGKIKGICRVSLPPYHGQFAGYISILTTEMPSSYKQQELRLEMVQLATSLYMADVVGKRR